MVRQSPLGWKEFDLVDMDGRKHISQTRLQFSVEPPHGAT